MTARHSLGLITSSNFYVPQVPVPGSMAQFVLPAGVPVAPAKHAGSGMGLITSSSFFVPQVNLPGSMASFVLPAGVPVAPPVTHSGMHGLGMFPNYANGLSQISFGNLGNYLPIIAIAAIALWFMNGRKRSSA
jgi:hypothetical protein